MLANPNGIKRRRYIDLLHRLLQNLIPQNYLQLVHVPATGQNEDILYKPMKRGIFLCQFQTLRSGTVPPYRGSVSQ